MTNYITHIPRAGRHGMLIELKDDRGYCMILRDRIENAKRRSFEVSAHASARIPDENDMCLCGAAGAGGVWSTIISTLADDWEERLDRYFGQLGRSYPDEAEEEMRGMMEYERGRAELYMTQDVSLASGETYRRH